MATKNNLSLNSTALSYNEGELCIEDVSVTSMASKHKTPFFVYGQKTLLANYQEFFGEAQMAGLESPLVCFALKSNPNKELLKLLANEGSGADIVSGGELKRALSAGIPAERIVFSGVGKTADEITLALNAGKNGIYSFNVESIEELELINFISGKLNKKARICFRLNPMVKAKTHKYISTGNKTHKFGLLKADIIKAAKNKKLWTHSQLVGLSVHIGSQLLDLKATENAVKTMCEVARALPQALEFLDVGGGLGVNYHPDETKKMPSISDYMSRVAKALESSYYSKFKERPKTRVVFEPGRRIIAKAGFFVMQVLRQKVSEDQRFVIVDGGMNDFMRPSLYDAFHDLVPVKLDKSKKRIPTHIVGPICETSDCFGHHRPMPPLKTGDLIVLADAGAYGFSMGSNYNLRGKPCELLVKPNGEVEVVNKAQSYEELK
ncbi:MAG: diaminopimelate decarboxylase [Bacteriovoracaceae bacterium]|nr:diaminopimelate decarboxylase [Bacteriovoracaceae bacterium]